MSIVAREAWLYQCEFFNPLCHEDREFLSKTTATMAVESIPFIYLCNLLEDIENTKGTSKRAVKVKALVGRFFSLFESGDIHQIFRLLIPEVFFSRLPFSLLGVLTPHQVPLSTLEGQLKTLWHEGGSPVKAVRWRHGPRQKLVCAGRVFYQWYPRQCSAHATAVLGANVIVLLDFLPGAQVKSTYTDIV